MRPFFPYYGSKWNIARYYPCPRHAHVVEPFAGSAGYSLFYEPKRVTLIDADPVIAGLWSYLLRVSQREILSLPELPEVGDCVDNYAIPQEAKWLIGFWLNRGSAQPKKSRTAYSARSDKSQLNWGPRAKERIASQLPGLAGWTITEGAYEQHAHCNDATYFVDPPYVEKGKFYRVGFSNYEELSRWCRAIPSQAIVCEGVGATWLPFKALGDFKSSKGRALEVRWLNSED
ncbi:MAG: hypothetical protein E6R03_06770 [Hyphomicrobiaceae bacterium]|nr:MAG: hypothetical protein E6R03_06770 [Hyphomicrobiaceae bacterium]